MVEVLLIPVAGLEQRLEIVLLHLLANDLLQCLPLQNLICFLLRTQLDQQGLVDAL